MSASEQVLAKLEAVRWVLYKLTENLLAGTCKKESLVHIEDALEDLKVVVQVIQGYELVEKLEDAKVLRKP
jgi:hypothetical protein